jgi:hypothetical protein
MANAFQFMATAFYIMCGSVCVVITALLLIGVAVSIKNQIKKK